MKEIYNYRHELKYQISYPVYLSLRQRLSAVMRADVHAGPDGRYFIRSIYFDNIDDKALREKIAGVQQREKFRIRYYNNDFSRISLEKKIKHNNLCLKLDAKLTGQECQALLDGQTEWMAGHPEELVRELYCKTKMQQLRPRVFVSYIREPFIYKAGNVRVTFDSNIRTSMYHKPCLESHIPDISALDTPDELVLEVKYDAFLPDVIARLLQTDGLRQGAFSKYGACRRFG